MRFYWLALGILGAWRITHLCVAEDGPWDCMARLRGALHNAFWRKLMSCFYCVSVWCAFPLAVWIADNWRERVLLWPALSAGAILLERLTVGEPAVYREDPEPPGGREPH
ncbi:MAG TPA: hypothetical protein VMS37_11630 [Verrucomicrobiae bacterium]|nr:hypothetical protein [Verrucomicrobiae bacterium]